MFYLIDEAENTGKGANSVISMAHHFFQHHGHGEKIASIHFDNCSGQNKNNFVLWYGLWRVLVGKFHIYVLTIKSIFCSFNLITIELFMFI